MIIYDKKAIKKTTENKILSIFKSRKTNEKSILPKQCFFAFLEKYLMLVWNQIFCSLQIN